MTAVTATVALDGDALSALARAGVLEPLDRHFAATLGALAGERDPRALLAVALVSRATREGHVCVDLSRVAGTALATEQGEPALAGPLPALAEWFEVLGKSPLVGAGDGDDVTPLVRDARGRLYLRRYFQHEQRLAALLSARAALVPDVDKLDRDVLRAGVHRLFGAVPGEVDWQRVAVQVALLRRITVVSGGPGTGKTSLVVKLLALAALSAQAGGETLRALLLAPTGKAAARLGESVRTATASLPISDALRATLPDRAWTIHRALRTQHRGRAYLHGCEQPWSARWVIVDESSMVDVALMRHLLDAVAPDAQVVLLGDRHQLASVEAGAVLADVCAGAQPGFSPELSAAAARVFGEALPGAQSGSAPGGAGEAAHEPAVPVGTTLPLFGRAASRGAGHVARRAPMADSVVELVKSWRFDEQSGIGALAAALHDGDAARALAVLGDARYPDVTLFESPSDAERAALVASDAVRGYGPYLAAVDAQTALVEFNRFRVLCAHRRGPAGVSALNASIEAALAEQRLVTRDARWYAGRPVLVTRNDHELGLSNGDVGIVRPVTGDPDLGAALRVAFAAADGKVRLLAPARLPEHETVYAMSIHKSQGSELDEVAVVLPEPRSPLLTRELLYTAVTRARRAVRLYGTAESVRTAIGRRVERASGLSELLYGGG